MVKVRPATVEDIKVLYPEGIRFSFQGITAEIDGKPVGTAGIYFNRNWIAFARITNELRPHKLAIWRACKQVINMMQKLNKPVYAYADPSIPRSEQMLMKMGFVSTSKDWYVWTP